MGHIELSPESDSLADLVPKLKIEIVIDDDRVNNCIRARENAAKTGTIGDGKICVSNVEQAVRIRTGESGVDAI